MNEKIQFDRNIITRRNMKYTCISCKKILTPGNYFCIDCAQKSSIADENGEFKSIEEWIDWARDYYLAERDLRILNAKKIIETEDNLERLERIQVA